MENMVFISYSRNDVEIVDKIVEIIKKVPSVTVWYDKRIRGGQNYIEEISSHICESKFFIFIVSDNSIQSKWCKKELNLAVELQQEQQEQQEQQIIVIPIYLNDDEIIIPEEMRLSLTGTHHINYSESDKLFTHEIQKIFVENNCQHYNENTLSLRYSRYNKFKNYITIQDEEVTENDIRQALELDKKYYKIPDNEQFDIEKCKRWNQNTGHQVYTMIKDTKTGNVVGYINAVPVNDKCYEEIKAGKYADAEIDDNDIEPYKFPNIPRQYNLYFASIVIDSKKDRFERFKTLYDAFISKVKNLAESDIFFSRMIADAVSDAGQSLCEGFGMRKIKDTDHDNSKIYEVELFPPKFSIGNKVELKKLYNVLMTKYKELEEFNKNCGNSKNCR